MAADTTLLQGQIVDENSAIEKDVEGLLRCFLRSLVQEIHVSPSMLHGSIEENSSYSVNTPQAVAK